MVEEPLVSIIILNWNRPLLTIKCLESLRNIKYNNIKIIIVDNGSVDGSVKAITDHLVSNYNKKNIYINEKGGFDSALESGDPELRRSASDDQIAVYLLANELNLGFSGGCNIGMKFALLDAKVSYVLLLNNDITTSEDFLNCLVKVGEDKERNAIIGPKVLVHAEDGSDIIDFAGGGMDLRKGIAYHHRAGEKENGMPEENAAVEYIEGSCMLIKRSIFPVIGYFDTDFFAYYEETDYCFRAKRSGYDSVYCPSSRVWHKTSFSTHPEIREYFLTRNRIKFVRKHGSPNDILLFYLYFFMYDTFRVLKRCAVEKRDLNLYRSFLFGAHDGFSRKGDRYFQKVMGRSSPEK